MNPPELDDLIGKARDLARAKDSLEYQKVQREINAYYAAHPEVPRSQPDTSALRGQWGEYEDFVAMNQDMPDLDRWRHVRLQSLLGEKYDSSLSIRQLEGRARGMAYKDPSKPAAARPATGALAASQSMPAEPGEESPFGTETHAAEPAGLGEAPQYWKGVGAAPEEAPSIAARDARLRQRNWNETLARGLEWRLSPQQAIERYLSGEGITPGELGFRQATQIMGRMEAELGPGFSEAQRQSILFGRRARPPSRGLYADLTERGAVEYRTGVPVPPDRSILPGHTWSGRKARQIPLEAERTSYLARGEGDTVYSAVEEAKFGKRGKQRVGYEMLQLGESPVVEGIKAGPGSLRPERFQIARQFVATSEFMPSGSGAYAVEQAEFAHKRRALTYWAPLGEKPEGLLSPRRYKASDRLVPMAGMRPMHLGGWRATIPEGGVVLRQREVETPEGKQIQYGVTYSLDLTRQSTRLNIGMKTGASKNLLTPLRGSNMRTAGGAPLGMITVLNEPQGMLHAAFQAEWAQADAAGRAAIASQMGIPLEQLTDYATHGKKIFERYQGVEDGKKDPEKALAARYATTARFEQLVHVSMLDRLKSTTMPGSVRDAPQGADWKMVTREVPGFAFPQGMAMRAMQEYDVKQVTFGALELQRMREAERLGTGIPGLYQHVMEASQGPRTRARDVVNAYAAELGEGSPPENVIDVSTSAGRNLVFGIQAQAEKLVRAEGKFKDTETVPTNLMIAPFFDLLSRASDESGKLGSRMIKAGEHYIPAARALREHSASAEHLDHGMEAEVSPIMTSAYNLMMGTIYGGSAGVSQGEEDKGEELDVTALGRRFTRALGKIANSANTRKFAVGGAALPRDMARGMTGYGSPALAPGTAYVPGMEGKAIMVTRNPSGGPVDYTLGHVVAGITRKQAEDLGMDPSKMYIREENAANTGGDFDADKFDVMALAALQEDQRTFKTSGINPEGKRVTRTFTLGSEEHLNLVEKSIQERVHLGRKDVREDYPRRRTDRAKLSVDEMNALTVEGHQALQQKAMAREALQKFMAYNLSPVDREKQEALAKEWHNLRDVQVGKHYKPYLRYLAAARGDPEAYGAIEKLFELSYARTQTPLYELPVMQRLHMLSTVGAKGNYFDETAPEGKGAVSARDINAGGRGMTGLMIGAAKILHEAAQTLGPDGRPLMTAREIAASMGPEDVREELAKAYAQPDFAKVQAAQIDLVGMGRWHETSIGGALGGQFVAKAEDATSPETMLRRTGLSAETAAKYRQVYSRARGFEQALGKPYGIKGEFETWMGALRNSGLGKWLLPKKGGTTAAATEAPAVSPAQAVQAAQTQVNAAMPAPAISAAAAAAAAAIPASAVSAETLNTLKSAGYTDEQLAAMPDQHKKATAAVAQEYYETYLNNDRPNHDAGKALAALGTFANTYPGGIAPDSIIPAAGSTPSAGGAAPPGGGGTPTATAAPAAPSGGGGGSSGGGPEPAVPPAQRIRTTLHGGTGVSTSEPIPMTKYDVKTFQAAEARYNAMLARGAFDSIDTGSGLSARQIRVLSKGIQGLISDYSRVAEKMPGEGEQEKVYWNAQNRVSQLQSYQANLKTWDLEKSLDKAFGGSSDLGIEKLPDYKGLKESVKAETEAHNKIVDSLKDVEASNEELTHAQKEQVQYSKIMKLGGEAARERQGELRLGLGAVEARMGTMRPGDRLTHPEIETLQAASRHLDPEVRERAQMAMSAARAGGMAPQGIRQMGGSVMDELAFGWTAFRMRMAWGLTTGQQRAAEGTFYEQAGLSQQGAMLMGSVPTTGTGLNQALAARAIGVNAQARFGQGVSNVLGPLNRAVAGWGGTETLGAASTILGYGAGAGLGAAYVANLIGTVGDAAVKAGATGRLAAGAAGLLNAAPGIGLAVGIGTAGILGASYLSGESKKWMQYEGAARGVLKNERVNELTRQLSNPFALTNNEAHARAEKIVAAEEAAWQPGNPAYDSWKLNQNMQQRFGGRAEVGAMTQLAGQLGQMAGLSTAQYLGGSLGTTDVNDLLEEAAAWQQAGGKPEELMAMRYQPAALQGIQAGTPGFTAYMNYWRKNIPIQNQLGATQAVQAVSGQAQAYGWQLSKDEIAAIQGQIGAMGSVSAGAKKYLLGRGYGGLGVGLGYAAGSTGAKGAEQALSNIGTAEGLEQGENWAAQMVSSFLRGGATETQAGAITESLRTRFGDQPTRVQQLVVDAEQVALYTGKNPTTVASDMAIGYMGRSPATAGQWLQAQSGMFGIGAAFGAMPGSQAYLALGNQYARWTAQAQAPVLQAAGMISGPLAAMGYGPAKISDISQTIGSSGLSSAQTQLWLQGLTGAVGPYPQGTLQAQRFTGAMQTLSSNMGSAGVMGSQALWQAISNVAGNNLQYYSPQELQRAISGVGAGPLGRMAGPLGSLNNYAMGMVGGPLMQAAMAAYGPNATSSPANQALREAMRIGRSGLERMANLAPGTQAAIAFNAGLGTLTDPQAQLLGMQGTTMQAFASRGVTPTSGDLTRAGSFASQYGQNLTDFMAGQYNTFYGWSMRQPFSAGDGSGGYWAKGGYESAPGWGIQELGTIASFGRRWNALGRNLTYRLGSAGGAWTAGKATPTWWKMQGSEMTRTTTEPTGEQGWNFSAPTEGGSYGQGGAPWGLEGQLRISKDMQELSKNLRALDNTMIQANRGYQQTQIGFARERASLQLRQGMESLDLQYRQFQAQTAYQRREMDIQAYQTRVQIGWGRQDLSYQQSVAGLQYGWQQEDFGRQIRFATGRERQQLRREQGRAQVMYSMEEGQRGRERERFETQAQWQTQALERQKAYFEQMTQLQEEYFAMQKRHLLENYSLTMRELDAQQAHLNTMAGLEDARRKLEEDWDKKQFENQQESIKKEIELAKLESADAMAQLAAEEELAKKRGEWMQEQVGQIAPGGKAWNAWDDFFNWMDGRLKGIKNEDGNSGNSGNSGSSGEGGTGTTYSPGEKGQKTIYMPTPNSGLSTGPVQVVVYLGTRELEELMVDVTRKPVYAGALADDRRRANNRRL